ncbi:MFS transporter [Streptomyces sp. NPDC091266]|uniref:MFS transporter n=1 Tax=Streptomyces sp. NPDC091266 TaxID=3365978 RepID=UPI0037F6395F
MGLFVIGVDITVLNVAVPSLAAHLRPAPGMMEWILDGYTLTLACGVLAAGAFADRYGRRRAFAGGLVLFLLASLAGAAATSAPVVLGSRLVMGAGAAMVMPATLATISTLFLQPQLRRRAVACWVLVAGLGGLAGPLLGGQLMQHYGWRAGFWINVPVLAATLAACRWVPETREDQAPRVDVRGAALAGAAVLGLVFAIIHGGHHGWGGPAALALAASVACGTGFTVHARRTPHALLPSGLWSTGGFGASMVVLAGTAFCLFGALLMATFHAQARLGDSPASAGARLLPLAAGMVLGAGIAAGVGPRWDERRVVAGGMLLIAVSYLPIATAADVCAGRLALFLVTAGAGAGMAALPATLTVLACVPAGQAGIGSAVNDATREIGAALGIAVTAALLTGPYTTGGIAQQHTALQQTAAAGGAVALLTAAAAGAGRTRPTSPARQAIKKETLARGGARAPRH